MFVCVCVCVCVCGVCVCVCVCVCERERFSPYFLGSYVRKWVEKENI